MIVGTCFDGDNEEDLKMFQHNCYYESLGRWVGMVSQHCQLRQGTSVEWDNLIQQWKEKVQDTGSFDHRCIQAPHDLIAAKYRKFVKEEISHGVTKGNKLGWCDFFNKEAAACLDQEKMLRSFMSSLTFSGSEAGYDAEDKLYESIQLRYSKDRGCK